MTVTVREATPDDRLGVRRVLDGAMLAVRDDLPERIEAGDVLVAERGGAPNEETDRSILGALVLVPPEDGDCTNLADAEYADAERTDRPDGEYPAVADPEKPGTAHVDAVAVRRALRGQGVGSALVRTAAERHGRLTAAFDPDVRPFYESLGFDVSEREDGRLRGTLE